MLFRPLQRATTEEAAKTKPHGLTHSLTPYEHRPGLCHTTEKTRQLKHLFWGTAHQSCCSVPTPSFHRLDRWRSPSWPQVTSKWLPQPLPASQTPLTPRQQNRTNSRGVYSAIGWGARLETPHFPCWQRHQTVVSSSRHTPSMSDNRQCNAKEKRKLCPQGLSQMLAKGFVWLPCALLEMALQGPKKAACHHVGIFTDYPQGSFVSRTQWKRALVRDGGINWETQTTLSGSCRKTCPASRLLFHSITRKEGDKISSKEKKKQAAASEKSDLHIP